MTFSDHIRRTASAIKSTYRNTRVWKIDEKKLGYIPIPKCASSSIRNHLSHHQWQTIKPEKTPIKSELESVTKVSMPPRKVESFRKDYYLFSFVRNPLSRLYSCYRDKVVKAEQRRQRCSLSPYKIHFGMSFDQFVSRVIEIPDKIADQHFRSASSFLVHQGKLQVDFVGRFEHFNQDWEIIASRFDLAPPDRNRRVSGPSVDLADIPLSPSLLPLVIEKFAQDLDHFSYREELEGMLT